jgi:ABC-type multidrug transport system ATPase subunit
MLAGLLRPSRGRVLLYGRPVIDDVEVRRRLGNATEHDGV